MDSLLRLYNYICKPHHSLNCDPNRARFLYQRNRLVFITGILYVIFAIIDKLTFNIQNPVVTPPACITVVISFTILKKYPLIYEIFVTIFMVILYPGYQIIQTSDITYFTLGKYLCIGTIVYYVTRRFSLFIVATIVTFLWIIFYSDELLQAHGFDVSSHSKTKHVWFLCIFSFFQTVFFKSLDKSQNEALQRKIEAENLAFKLQEFTQQLSHELRNPLNSLSGNIDLALTHEMERPARSHIETAKASCSLVLQLINNILDSGKAEYGELEITPKPTDLKGVLTKVWGIYSDMLLQKNLKAAIFLEKNIPAKIKIDDMRVSQVLINLLSNAYKFTIQGRVIVNVNWYRCQSDGEYQKIELEDPYADAQEGSIMAFEEEIKHGRLGMLPCQYTSLTFDRRKFELQGGENRSSFCQKGMLKISVVDSGPGMSLQKTEKLFQKYSQVSDDAQSRRQGSGLGLFITKEIIEKMGGKIQCFSKVGIGSTFVVVIPCEANEG